jgi:hypothetical protein
MMSSLLITIQDTFDIPAFRGLVVVPGPLQAEYTGPSSMDVVLKRPDGTSLVANLEMQFVHQTPPPKELRWCCILQGLHKEQVPVGTQVWVSN